MTWRNLRVKHLARIRVSNIDKLSKPNELSVRLVNYTDVYHGDKIVPELELMPATATASQIQTFKVQPGDVLITKDSETADDIGVPAYVERSSPDMVCGYHLALLRPIPQQTFGRFLYWAMNSKYVNDQLAVGSTGITRYGLKLDVISQARIKLPPLSTQQNIANYLDTETARIDTLVVKKRRLVELLNKHRQAAITAAFTGKVAIGSDLPTETDIGSGLDFDAQHKEVKEIRPLRAYAEVHLGRQRSPQHDTGPYMTSYLRAANVKDGELDLSDVKSMNFEPGARKQFSLQRGDVLVTEGSGSLAAVGASAVWNGKIEEMICFQNTLLRLRPRGSTDPRFLAWWCRYAYADGLFASVAQGANIYHISAERVRSLPMAYVPPTTQLAIADYLDAETNRIDSIIERENQTVDLLVERRQTLITAAVTGKMSVSGVEA